MPHLAIIGGTVVDTILPDTKQLPTWPEHTEFTARNLVLLKNPPLVTIGGNGANAAYVAARRGATVTLHTALGTDGLGSLARQWLREARVAVQSPKQVTTTALNVTAANKKHQRATFFYPGTPPIIPHTKLLRDSPAAVLVCGWPHPPLAQIAHTFKSLRKKSILTALDTGPILEKPWTLTGLRPVLAALDLLLTNEHELLAISRTKQLTTALTKLRRTFRGHIILKRGADGVWWLAPSSDTPQIVAPHEIKAVNTVGAGDTFNGALLAAWLRGLKPLAAIREANRVAAKVVASHRGVLGTPKRR